MVGEERVLRLPLLRIPARPGWVSSFTGKGDGGSRFSPGPLGGAASASAAPGPGLPPETPPRAQSRTQADRGGSQSTEGSQVTCEEAWLGAWRLHRGAE